MTIRASPCSMCFKNLGADGTSYFNKISSPLSLFLYDSLSLSLSDICLSLSFWDLSVSFSLRSVCLSVSQICPSVSDICNLSVSLILRSVCLSLSEICLSFWDMSVCLSLWDMSVYLSILSFFLSLSVRSVSCLHLSFSLTHRHPVVHGIMNHENQRTDPHKVTAPREVQQRYGYQMVDHHLFKVLPRQKHMSS